MIDSKYSDCQIVYQTLDHTGEFFGHRYILSKSGYIDGIFKYTKSDNIPLIYHLNLSEFTEKILMESIKILYDSQYQYNPTLELYECVNFLSFEQHLVEKIYIDICMEIGKVLHVDPNRGFQMLENVLSCHLINSKQQKYIIERYYEILNEKYQKKLSHTLKIPKQEKLLKYGPCKIYGCYEDNCSEQPIFIINQFQKIFINYDDYLGVDGKIIVDYHNGVLYYKFVIDHNFSGEIYGNIIVKIHDFIHGTNVTKKEFDYDGNDEVSFFEIPYEKNTMISIEIYVDKFKWYL